MRDFWFLCFSVILCGSFFFFADTLFCNLRFFFAPLLVQFGLVDIDILEFAFPLSLEMLYYYRRLAYVHFSHCFDRLFTLFKLSFSTGIKTNSYYINIPLM